MTQRYLLKYTSNMDKLTFSLNSKLLLTKSAEEFLTLKRVKLLENIIVYGSISKAAKASGITYKTAWAWIDKMNSLAPKALVQKISGGKGGGGTLITAYAKELISLFEEVEALHEQHLNTLERAFEHLEDEERKSFSFARLEAEVVEILRYEKRATLNLRLGNGSTISAQAPIAFVDVNQLKASSLLSVLIESESVSVSKSLEKEISSRNKLNTKVIDIMIDGNDVLLVLGLHNDESLVSQITYQSFEELNIKKGDELLALFKAYNVTLLCEE